MTTLADSPNPINSPMRCDLLWQLQYVDVLSPICSTTSALPKFLENSDVQNFIDAVKDREREAYEAAVRAQLATPQSNLESTATGNESVAQSR